MKKKILFIISNMESGGVSKSMSSLLNVIDTNRYEVDCLILSPQGIFMDSLPKTIHVISNSSTALVFSKFPQNLKGLLAKGYFADAFYRLLAGICMLFNKGWGGWLLSRRILKINKNYDLAVDYNGQHQLYYLIDRVQAKKKITFFHNDYEKWPYYYGMDKKYMPKADAIFTVSDQCVASLKRFFPSSEAKIGLFENISSVKTVYQLAALPVEDGLDQAVHSLISVGHLTERKGTSLAIKAAHLLKQRGILFKWYFVGNDQEKDHYLRLVKDYGLTEHIIFMGLRANPYPYIQQADLLVHPSKFEGKSIALDEAKILCKAIVVTDFSTVGDQFTNRVNASICRMTAEDLADKIEELLTHDELRQSYERYLTDHVQDNSTEIEKLYHLIDQH